MEIEIFDFLNTISTLLYETKQNPKKVSVELVLNNPNYDIIKEQLSDLIKDKGDNFFVFSFLSYTYKVLFTKLKKLNVSTQQNYIQIKISDK